MKLYAKPVQKNVWNLVFSDLENGFRQESFGLIVVMHKTEPEGAGKIYLRKTGAGAGAVQP